MKILLANPRGFCAGVDRAIEIVERALALLLSASFILAFVMIGRALEARPEALPEAREAARARPRGR